MKNRTTKRTTRSRAKTFLTATGLALALTSAIPAAGPVDEGQAEAQYFGQRTFVIGHYQLCLSWCFSRYCCGDKGTFPMPFETDLR